MSLSQPLIITASMPTYYLKKGPGPKGRKKKGRRKVYQVKVVQALIQVWEICGRIRSIRLNPYQPGEQGRGFPDQLSAASVAP
jgi:hypothetical protein